MEMISNQIQTNLNNIYPPINLVQFCVISQTQILFEIEKNRTFGFAGIISQIFYSVQIHNKMPATGLDFIKYNTLYYLANNIS